MKQQEKHNVLRQFKTTTSFTNYTNKKIFKIFHNLTCKSKFLIYVMECVLCKLQYVEKKDHLIYALIITGLTNFIEMRSLHVVNFS